MTGKLPVTQKMIFESNESQWRMLMDGLINILKTSAIIELKKESKRVRINLIITDIFPPEKIIKRNICSTETNLGEDFSIGLNRSKKFIIDYLEETAWFFIGYIDGEIITPILITHYQSIDLTIYTQKLNQEESKLFFPKLNLN